MRARRVLVIRGGAFGDFIQSFAAFAAIRHHHRDAQVTLLTAPAFLRLARAAPWFDEVLAEAEPSWRDLGERLALARRLRQGRFDRVYDLESARTLSLRRLAVGFGAAWAGIARPAARDADPARRARLHTPPRQQEGLRRAGIGFFPAPRLDWLAADVSGLGLPPAFWLMVPGGAGRVAGKRWPVGHYAELARAIGLPAVIVGGPAESILADAVRGVVPSAIDLTGDRSPPPVLAGLAGRAAFALGNETGPMHLIAAMGCPTMTLFGPLSDPALDRPQGASSAVLAARDLAKLGVNEVLVALAAFLPPEARAAGGLPWTGTAPAGFAAEEDGA